MSFSDDTIIVSSIGKTGPRLRTIIKQMVKKARREIMAEEDAALFKAIDSGNKDI